MSDEEIKLLPSERRTLQLAAAWAGFIRRQKAAKRNERKRLKKARRLAGHHRPHRYHNVPLWKPVTTYPSPSLQTFEVGRTDDMLPWEGPSEFDTISP